MCGIHQGPGAKGSRLEAGYMYAAESLPLITKTSPVTTAGRTIYVVCGVRPIGMA